MAGVLELMTVVCEGMAPDGQPVAHEQVQWCPAWGLWLCADCRLRRNETELKMPASLPVRLPAEPMILL